MRWMNIIGTNNSNLDGETSHFVGGSDTLKSVSTDSQMYLAQCKSMGGKSLWAS